MFSVYCIIYKSIYYIWSITLTPHTVTAAALPFWAHTTIPLQAWQSRTPHCLRPERWKQK